MNRWGECSRAANFLKKNVGHRANAVRTTNMAVRPTRQQILGGDAMRKEWDCCPGANTLIPVAD